MELYNTYRKVPESAQKTITAGRLKGMTDINPMWRIQCLTEAFGPCGIGWFVRTHDKWITEGTDGEKVAWVSASLFIKKGEGEDDWSEAIEGIGGSMLVANERNGAHTSDEAFKMAYTDAISVCCKMLGFGADVYWSAGRTKYSDSKETQEPEEKKPEEKKPDPLDKLITCDICGEVIKNFKDTSGKVTSPEEWKKKSIETLGRCVCNKCIKEGRHIGE